MDTENDGTFRWLVKTFFDDLLTSYYSTYDQNEFFDDSANDNGLDNEGYVFIPDRLGKNLDKTFICKS